MNNIIVFDLTMFASNLSSSSTGKAISHVIPDMKHFKTMKEKQPSIKFPYLNDDVLIQIFGYLSANDVMGSIRVSSRRFKELVDGGRIFKLKQWIEKLPEPGYIKARCAGREFFDKEDWENAIHKFTKSILMNPKDHLSYFWRAYSFAESEKYDLALQDFTRSLELDPNDATTFSNRGATYRDVGNHEKALKDLESAIKLDPHSASAYNNRGVVYGDLGRYEEAVIEYTKAIEADPTHLIALRNRARRYQKMGRNDEARKDFNLMLELNPKDPESLRFFVCCEIKGMYGYKKPSKFQVEQDQAM